MTLHLLTMPRRLACVFAQYPAEMWVEPVHE